MGHVLHKPPRAWPPALRIAKSQHESKYLSDLGPPWFHLQDKSTMCVVQAAEDLVLCAMVRSALTTALSLPVSAAPSGTTPAAPSSHSHTSSGMATRPLLPGHEQPSRPQTPHTAQIAKPPTLPTAPPAQPAPPLPTSTPAAQGTGGYVPSPAAVPPAGMASTNTSLAGASGGSLAALLSLPLPVLSESAQPVLSASAATVSAAAAGPQTLPSPAAVTPSVPQPLNTQLASSATAATAAAAATIGGSHLSSTAASQPALSALPGQQQPVQAGVSSLSQAVGSLHAAPVPGLHSTGAVPGVPLQLRYSSAQQQQLVAPTLATLSQAPPVSGGQALLAGGQASASSGQASLGGRQVSAGGGQVSTSGGQAPASGGQAAASSGQHARPGVPAAVGSGGAGQQGAAAPNRASSGQSKAVVGEEVWQLASDVMAAGGTATTAAAVTTAAQQVRGFAC